MILEIERKNFMDINRKRFKTNRIMKTTIYFIAGIVFSALISATTVSVMTVKPQMPKNTIVKPFWGAFGIQEDMTSYIKYKIKQGYIVKSLCLDSEENGYQRGIVIMEKY